MRAPKLQKGAKIGVFSASSPISATVPIRYERGRAFLESKGFQVVNGSLFGKKDGYRSGSIRARAEEFNELLHREDVDVLMSAIGGYNSNAILPYIDYEYLKKHPKIIVGYSDTTALLLGIYAQTGLVTFYGPALAASFGEFPPFVEETFAAFVKMTGGVQTPYDYPAPSMWTEEFIPWDTQDRAKTGQPNEWECLIPGKVTGRLMGGNLNTLEGIFGTPYMPEIREGDILLLEDSLTDAATVERSFNLLKLAGVFDKAGGVILGKHEGFRDLGSGRSPQDILLEVLDGKKLPILARFDCCHTHPMLTLPIGCKAELDAAGKRLTLLEEPVNG